MDCRWWICGKEIVQGFGGEETTKDFLKEERVLAKIMLLSHRVLRSKTLGGSEGEAGKERVRERV